MPKRSTIRVKRVARKPVARSRFVKSRPAKTRKRTTLVRSVIRKNPQKVAIKRKIRQRRPVHKRILLHPLTILIILCVTVFVANWTYKSIADSFQVTATVPAPLLTQGAVITSPANGQTLNTTPITVSGTCPANSYVTLNDNSLFSGSAVCVNGSFQIPDSLYLGSNTLSAQDYNEDSVAGPGTSPISVTYTVPPSPPSNNTNNGGSSSSGSSAKQSTAAASAASAASPLLLTTPVQYNTFTTQTVASWQIDLQGGVPPYVVTVSWGDGTSTTYTFNTDPIFTVSHTYANSGYYPIEISTKDALGTKRIMQLATIVKKPGQTAAQVIAGLGNGSSTPTIQNKPNAKPTVENNITSFMQASKDWLFLIWPSLIVVILMIASFWLGERQELHIAFSMKRRKQYHR